MAEQAGELVGWISGYVPPARPDAFFVWQVAVSAAARGQGLGLRMLEWLVRQPAAARAQALTTTITADNAASWALFSAFARRQGASLAKAPRFDRSAHFGGAQDTEWGVTIGLARAAASP